MTSHELGSDDIRHVLLTRYNLALPGGTDNLRPDWLRSRYELFTRFCVPSVLAQDDQDFLWLVMLDQRTPSAVVTEIEEVLPANGRVILLSDPLDETPMANLLASAGVAPSAALMTSRLDNDDCIGVSYIRLVADAGRRHTGALPVAFNFPLGYQFSRGEAYGAVDLANPFLTLLEPPLSRTTVLGVSHREMATVAPVRQLKACPQWLQVVHDENLDNEVRGVRLPRKVLKRSFGYVVSDAEDESWVDILVGAIRSVTRVVRAAVRRLALAARQQ